MKVGCFSLKDKSITLFLDELSSKQPVPGGGGASSLVAAIGTGLGSMVGNLTVGKKKYASVEPEVKELIKQAEALIRDFEDLISEDAKGFEPLAKAYGLPKSTPEEIEYKEKVLETALVEACRVPMEIMRKSLEAIELQARMAEIGTRIAISDVGIGVEFCKAALKGASLNVYINTKMMKDKEVSKKLEDECGQMIETGTKQADAVYQAVIASF